MIGWMLCIDTTRRPGVEDLLNLPNVSSKVREARLADTTATIAKQDDDILRRE